MSRAEFKPTDEQLGVIKHEGHAFVSACPGGGKTRVLVERARLLLAGTSNGKGIAFLSFTKAATSELDQRLRREGLLASPPFPNFVGTFDSFLWQFLVAPFGLPGCEHQLRLIPDMNDRMVRPYTEARELPLSCFDRTTGNIVEARAKRVGFDPSRTPSLTRAYIKAATSLRNRLHLRGEIDFEDARSIAASHLQDTALSSRLAAALEGRFREVIVDEAQDCNPSDLLIIKWLRDAGIPTKVVCDPFQSIYGFRGGVTDELLAFSKSFEEKNQLSMNGNFRSSDAICNAIVALRPMDARVQKDLALGKNGKIRTPVHILAYSGAGVPDTIGAKWKKLVEGKELDLASSPVLAATRDSGAKAVGRPIRSQTSNLTLRIASAVAEFHFAFESGNHKEALAEVHKVVLEIEGLLGEKTYHQYLTAEQIEPIEWRPRIIHLVRQLRYDSSTFATHDDWLSRARELLEPHLPDKSRTIKQVLKRNAGLADALAAASGPASPAKTIHSVKGREFPAVCVVMTARTAKEILSFLTTGAPLVSAEEARKIYVAASRAEQLLAIAIPRSQANHLENLLVEQGSLVSVTGI